MALTNRELTLETYWLFQFQVRLIDHTVQIPEKLIVIFFFGHCLVENEKF